MYSLVVIYFGKEDMGIKVQILAVGPGFCGIFALWASGIFFFRLFLFLFLLVD